VWPGSVIRVHKVTGVESDHQVQDRDVADRTFNLFCIVLLFFASSNAADTSRFFRILKQYSDPVYHASDRKLFIEGEYNSTSNDSVPTEIGFSRESDTVRNFKRTASHDLGMKGIWLRGNAWSTRRTDLNAGLKGEYACSSMVRSNELIGREDIEQDLEVVENLYLDLSHASDKYFVIKGRQKGFIGYTVWSMADLAGVYERTYISELLSSERAMIRKDKIVDFTERLGFEPSVGWGKPTFVTPLYRAFEIERALKESGAVQGNLSDATMVRIAQWLAAEFSVTETKDRPRKYVFAALDTILKRDSAAIKSPQTTFALMNAVEKHDNVFPFLFSGVKLSIAGTINTKIGYEEASRVASYLDEQLYGGSGFYFDQTNDFPFLKLEWGKVLSPHLFLSFGAKSSSLVTVCEGDLDVGFDYQLRLDGSFYYLINDRMYLDLGFSNLSLGFTSDFNQPDLIWLRGHYFIEEKIGLVLTLTHGYHENIYRHNYDYRSIQTITDRLSLELQYEF
jgi:hypothetical protein